MQHAKAEARALAEQSASHADKLDKPKRRYT